MNQREGLEASIIIENSATTTLSSEPEEFSLKILGPVDPKIDALELDLTLTQHLSKLNAIQEESDNSTETKKEGPIYVDFKKGDRRNPANFTKTRKWITTLIACYATLLASSVATAYTLGFPSMMRDLNCTDLQAIAGLSVYMLGFGIVPLVTASLSEEFGRKPLYIVSSFIFLVMFVMIALAKNIQTVLVGRFLQGAAGSTGSTMVAGTITDIWSPKERGIPMSLFSFAAISGAGLGPLMAGWIEMNVYLGWRWIQWIQMMYCGIYFILSFFIPETRPGVLLTRLSKKIRKETGDKRYRARIEDERPSLLTLIRISCTRPIYLTVTEPIVAAFCLWVVCTWGITFSLIDVSPLVYKTLHHFNIGFQGTTFVSLVIGALFGLLTTFRQDFLYRRNVAKRGPEARLYAACFASILLPTGLFIFAWSMFPQVHWIVPNIGMVCFVWAIYIIYQAIFSYLSDCYGIWASSASAGQSLARNIVATAFPLFSTQMFERLTFKWAGTLFACIGVLMVPIPFVLFFWGPAIRKRSKVASKLLQV